MAIRKENLGDIAKLSPASESKRRALEESKQLLGIGSRAGGGALGLSSYRLGRPLKEVGRLIKEGYIFLEKDLGEDLKMIEKGPRYPISKRLEKHYDPEKMIREVFPNEVEGNEKITSEEINKIRLKISGWEKILKKLLRGQRTSDKQLENLQDTLGNMSLLYIRRANKCFGEYVQGRHPGVNID